MERIGLARPAPRPARRHALRIELAACGGALADRDGAARAAFALAATYGGEPTVVLGFGGVRHIRPRAVSKLVRQASWLVEPWGREGRIELRSLRPAVRRTLLVWLAGRDDLTLVACARRTLVVSPIPAASLRLRAALAGLGANRRRLLLLAARDGEHCVWCRKPLTHRSPDATADHVRCRSHGGANALDNLVLACAECNHRRADAPADVWLARRLAAGATVDVAAVTAAIERSVRHRRRHLRRTPATAPGWAGSAAA